MSLDLSQSTQHCVQILVRASTSDGQYEGASPQAVLVENTLIRRNLEHVVGGERD
jgi:hypothetical protein